MDAQLLYSMIYALALGPISLFIVEKLLVRFDMGHLITHGFYRHFKDKLRNADDFSKSFIYFGKYFVFLAYATAVVTSQIQNFKEVSLLIPLIGPLMAFLYLQGENDVVQVVLWKKRRDFNNTLLLMSLFLIYVTSAKLQSFDHRYSLLIYTLGLFWAVFLWSMLIFHNFFTRESLHQKRSYRSFDHFLIISVGLLSLLPLLKFESLSHGPLLKGLFILFALYLLFLLYSLLLRMTLKEYNRIENRNLFAYCFIAGLISIATTLIN